MWKAGLLLGTACGKQGEFAQKLSQPLCKDLSLTAAGRAKGGHDLLPSRTPYRLIKGGDHGLRDVTAPRET